MTGTPQPIQPRESRDRAAKRERLERRRRTSAQVERLFRELFPTAGPVKVIDRQRKDAL